MILLVGVALLYSTALLYGVTAYVPRLHGFVTAFQYMQDTAAYLYGKARTALWHGTLKLV